MKQKLLLCISICIFTIATAQQKPAYILYDSKGKKVGYDKMIRKLSDRDIVLFGELHNNAIAHWLQLEVAMALKEKRELVMGAEMFEQDNQEALDLYLQGKIKAKGLDSMARLWKNYPTDYAPLVDFAKANNIPFIATNVPRRYASMTSKGGFEALDTVPAKEKNWIAPLPIAYDPALPGYTKMMEMMAGHGSVNMPKAQAIKDATMAHFILQHYKPGTVFLHFNGAYHSDNYDGINWYLKRQQPSLRYATITTVLQKDVKKLLDEHKGKADYIICVDEKMTNTY